jgi:hypothetical protein
MLENPMAYAGNSGVFGLVACIIAVTLASRHKLSGKQLTDKSPVRAIPSSPPPS